MSETQKKIKTRQKVIVTGRFDAHGSLNTHTHTHTLIVTLARAVIVTHCCTNSVATVSITNSL